MSNLERALDALKNLDTPPIAASARARIMADLPAGWSVTGPYHAPGDLHPHFRIDGPDMPPTSVLFVDGDPGAEDTARRRAHAAAAVMASI